MNDPPTALVGIRTFRTVDHESRFAIANEPSLAHTSIYAPSFIRVSQRREGLGPPVERINLPDFGRPRSMQNQSLGFDAGLNPLYQIGGPRSIQFGIKLQL